MKKDLWLSTGLFVLFWYNELMEKSLVVLDEGVVVGATLPAVLHLIANWRGGTWCQIPPEKRSEGLLEAMYARNKALHEHVYKNKKPKGHIPRKCLNCIGYPHLVFSDMGV